MIAQGKRLSLRLMTDGDLAAVKEILEVWHWDPFGDPLDTLAKWVQQNKMVGYPFKHGNDGFFMTHVAVFEGEVVCVTRSEISQNTMITYTDGDELKSKKVSRCFVHNQAVKTDVQQKGFFFEMVELGEAIIFEHMHLDCAMFEIIDISHAKNLIGKRPYTKVLDRPGAIEGSTTSQYCLMREEYEQHMADNPRVHEVSVS